jgi:WD40 repeat protein
MRPSLPCVNNQITERSADDQDDFYLNLVSWSSSNVLGVGLNSCVYLWSAQTSKVTKLCETTTGASDETPDMVTGIEWTNKVRLNLTAISATLTMTGKHARNRYWQGHGGDMGCRVLQADKNDDWSHRSSRLLGVE